MINKKLPEKWVVVRELDTDLEHIKRIYDLQKVIYGGIDCDDKMAKIIEDYGRLSELIQPIQSDLFHDWMRRASIADEWVNSKIDDIRNGRGNREVSAN